jgi:hypothetical protein
MVVGYDGLRTEPVHAKCAAMSFSHGAGSYPDKNPACLLDT